jgi:hypothetical protein
MNTGFPGPGGVRPSVSTTGSHHSSAADGVACGAAAEPPVVPSTSEATAIASAHTNESLDGEVST